MNSQLSSEATEEIEATCDKHGTFMAKVFRLPESIGTTGFKPIQTTCPVCTEEHRVIEEERSRENRLREQRAKIESALSRSCIPKRFMSRTLGSFIAEKSSQQRALDISKRFVESFEDSEGASLVFAGKPGTGKTHLACGIAKALIESGHSALFGTVLELIRHVKSTYRHDSERTEKDAMEDMLHPDLLVIDEVGAQIGSEHEKMILFEIINQRYQECRSTILISNLTRDELSQFLGDRALDRFRECGAVVAFDWESHRGSMS